MATGTDGRIWFNQYVAGALVHDPDADTTTLLRPDDSPLSGDRIVRIVAHPDGPILFMHDINDAGLVDVLLELEDSYHVNIHTDGIDMEEMKITTSYKEQSIDAILETIGAAFGMTVNSTADGYYLIN